MNYYEQIQSKLKSFYKKYYTNQLIKGLILFIALGLSYFILTSLVEYFLWLPKKGRIVLFWLFITVEGYLLVKFVGEPLLKLLNAKKGISLEELSKVVGRHFKEVQDKLINVLQLKTSAENSDLLLASIEQKSKELAPIPFNKAINYKVNLRYIKYALAPLVLILLFLFTDILGGFSDSFERVVRYNTAYQPPAPFSFYLKNDLQNVLQGSGVTLEIETKGKVIPEEARIFFNNQEYYLTKKGDGIFEFTFDQIQRDVNFYLEANGVRSESYGIDVRKTPVMKEIILDLNFPAYTREINRTLEAPKNIVVPEGTLVTWRIKASNVDNIKFKSRGKQDLFNKTGKSEYSLDKRLRNSFNYEISSSNEFVEDYENITFRVNVVKDESPKIEVQTNIDSLNNEPKYFLGQISDDYGLSKLQLVYQIKDNPETRKTFRLGLNTETLQTFYYSFPENLDLIEGQGYELFFEVFDNDAINGSKKSTSDVFYYRVRTEQEIEQQLLEDQRNYIQDLENSLLSQKRQKEQLKEIQNDLQNKQDMNWNDKNKLEKLMQRQKQYQQMMEKQTNNLLESLDQKKEEDQRLQSNKEELKKRIEELKKLKKQDKLLRELERLAQKLDKEEITRKTKQLAEQNKQQERSLERILELTKRFYVEQKTTQIANQLEELAKKQEELSKKQTNTENEQSKQDELNKEFNELEKELGVLKKDNEDLKKPMDLPDVSDEQYEVNKEQEKAKQNLSQQKPSEAKKNQKKAAQQMRKMSQKMMQTMMDMQAKSIEENADDLRKILKNLITFSFKQENLMNDFSEIDFQHPDFGKNLKKQNQLKTYFEHIDDSLYVLSMRVPQISSRLQNELADAHYNLDESLENFTERRFGSGTSNQQYVMTAANNIADFLSDLLNNMNNTSSSMSGKGKKSNSFSLPNIIQQQKGLSEKMKNGMSKQKNSKGQDKEGSREGKNKQDRDNGELYRIFQQQNQLKQQLQDVLREGSDPKGQGKKVIKSMEQLENEILEKGFNQEVIQRMQNLEYELLKLDNAALEQNKDKNRKSTTNKTQYTRRRALEIESKKAFFKQLEILNRQSLPLRQNYRKRVQEYFSKKKQ